jgi:Ni,Fe-hydrogenase III large subunit
MAGETSPPLLALWADAGDIYALLRAENGPLLVSTEVEEGGYPALSRMRPSAAWFERMVRDLWGYTAIGGIDQRPLLDHGHWACSAPMAARPGAPVSPEPPEFTMPDDLDQLAIGPVHGGMGPAAHLRLGIRGETIQRLQARLGYTHRGTLALMRGKSPRAAARFAARLAGEATVAHSLAFARATEAALLCEVPPRALSLRALMAAIERIAGDLDALAAIAEVAGRDAIAARFAQQGEKMRRAANVAFGHRLMMDCVIPGGLAADITSDGVAAFVQALAALAEDLPRFRRLARNLPEIRIPSRWPGARLTAIEADTSQASALVRGLPDGIVAVPLSAESSEGIGCADGPGGEVWHWLRLDHGQIAGVFMCDAAWANWQLLSSAAISAEVDDVALMQACLRVSSAGIDL